MVNVYNTTYVSVTISLLITCIVTALPFYSQEIIAHLPKKRKLTDNQENEVSRMLSMHGNKWLIHQHVVQQTGTVYLRVRKFLLCFVRFDGLATIVCPML